MNRLWSTFSWLVGNSIQVYGTVLSEEMSYVFVKLNFRESSVSRSEMLGRAAIGEERTGAPVCLLCVIPETPGAEFLLCPQPRRAHTQPRKRAGVRGSPSTQEATACQPLPSGSTRMSGQNPLATSVPLSLKEIRMLVTIRYVTLTQGSAPSSRRGWKTTPLGSFWPTGCRPQRAEWGL